MCVDVWQYLFMHRHQKLKLGLPQLWCLYIIYLFTYLCAVCVQDACVWARMLQGMCVGTYVTGHVCGHPCYRACVWARMLQCMCTGQRITLWSSFLLPSLLGSRNPAQVASFVQQRSFIICTFPEVVSSLWSYGWPGAYYVNQAGIELTRSLTSDPHVLVLKACAHYM